MGTRVSITTVCLVACSGMALAQESYRAADVLPQPDSVYRRNSASILFDRNLDTYNWIGRIAADTVVAGNRFAVTGQYISNIIVSNPGSRSSGVLRGDQLTLMMLLARPVSPWLHAQTQWNSVVSTDNKGVGLSNASSHSLLAGVAHETLPWLTLAPMAGYRWDDQAGTRDHGLTYNLAGATHGVDLDGYRIIGSGQYHRDLLDPRILESDFARIGVQKNFSPGTRDSLEGGFTRSRREFYNLGDSTIESRTDNVLGFTNLLDYELGGNVITSLFVTVATRWLDKSLRQFGTIPPQQPLFTTTISEFHLDAYIQTAYRSDDGNLSASARLYHSERDETHALAPLSSSSASLEAIWESQNQDEKTKDNLARRTALSGMADIPLSSSDRLYVSGWASILRYDTPSSENFDDRDELLVTASIGTSHRVSRYLDLGFTLDGMMSHLVYLLKERSANNNVNRVLRLGPRALYHPMPALTSLNVFEVLANYTVYDYDNALAQQRSFSYRQIGWLDSTAIALTGRIGLDFFVYLRLYERGQLNWDAFSERTQNSSVENTLATQVRFSPEPGYIFAAGIRYFSQTRYAYDTGVKTLDSFLSSFGPTCWIQLGLRSQSVISFRGWLEHRKQPGGTERTIGSMTLNLLISF